MPVRRKRGGCSGVLLREEKRWMEKWFSEIHRWGPKDVDLEIVSWLRCYGIPCHVWCSDFSAFWYLQLVYSCIVMRKLWPNQSLTLLGFL